MADKDLRALFRRYGPNGPDDEPGIELGRADGATAVDREGRSYLDFASGCQSPLGHNHPAIASALAAVGHRTPVAGGVWPEAVELAELLAEVVPGGTNRRVLVCESGREALAAAIRLAQERTQRSRVAYLADNRGEAVSVGRDVAAVVAHPLDLRLSRAAHACEAAGAMLIDDEAGVGPGLTGTMLAIEHLPVRAGLYVLGRGWAGGLPFGACVTGGSEFFWHGKAAANPIGCAAAVETIRQLKAGLIEQGAGVARVLELELEQVGLPWVLSGQGLVWTLHLEQGRNRAPGFAARCRKAGLLVPVLGPDAVGLRPPLVVGPGDVRRAVAVLKAVAQEFNRA